MGGLEAEVAAGERCGDLMYLGFREEKEITLFLSATGVHPKLKMRIPYPLAATEGKFTGLPFFQSIRVVCCMRILVFSTSGLIFDPGNVGKIRGFLVRSVSFGEAQWRQMGGQSSRIATPRCRTSRVVGALVDRVFEL